MGPLDLFLAELSRLGGVISAGEAAVAAPGSLLWRGAAGYRVGGEPLAADATARFDAASLTKPWIATLALALDAAGELPLDATIRDVDAGASGSPIAERTLEDLLRHRSGLRAWTPLAVRLGRGLGDRDALRRLLLGGEQITAPPVATLYSDLGYLLWGLLAEAGTGRRLADLLDARVCSPLGVSPLGALAVDPPNPVECRLDNGREVELAAAQGIRLERQHSFHLGRPQDGNARALGFLGGHAGLFVTVDEQLALAREWLRPGRLLHPEAVARALRGDGGYALGWKRAAPDGVAGASMSPAAFGHSGFTGGSLWIDPARDRIELLLAHRLASRIDFDPFRREFHRLAAELAEPTPEAAEAPPHESSPAPSKKLE